MILIYGEKRLEYNSIYMCVEFVRVGNTQENPPSDTACVALRARAKQNKKIKKQQERPKREKIYQSAPSPPRPTHAQSSPKKRKLLGVSLATAEARLECASRYTSVFVEKGKNQNSSFSFFIFPVRERLSSSCSSSLSFSGAKDGRVSTLFCWLLLFGWQWRRRTTTPTPFL